MNYIVCGWYTPDYECWLAPLRQSLDAVGAPHEFVRVDKLAGGWERNTLRKPSMIEDALRRNLDRVVIFLDVDSVVMQPLHDLAATTTDVALHLRGRLVRFGFPRITARSGTMVLRPTPVTFAFVQTWGALSDIAPRGTVDQRTLTVALARTPELTITNLPIRYCATSADDVTDPIILHDRASEGEVKVSKLMRSANRAFKYR